MVKKEKKTRVLSIIAALKLAIEEFSKRYRNVKIRDKILFLDTL